MREREIKRETEPERDRERERVRESQRESQSQSGRGGGESIEAYGEVFMYKNSPLNYSCVKTQESFLPSLIKVSWFFSQCFT